MQTWRYLTVLAVLTLVGAAHAQEAKPGEIRAQGEATVYVMPDKAGLSFTVQEQDKDLLKARELAATSMQAVLAAINALKLPNLTMKTQSVQVMPLYEQVREGGYLGDTMRKILGYRVSNTVAVTLKNNDPEALKEAVAKVIDAALLSGGDALNGPWFSKDDDKEARREALEKATREAVLNAEAMARGLDVKIAKFTYVSMVAQAQPMPMYQERAMMAMAGGAGGGGTPSPIEIEALPIGATVYVNAEY